MPKIFPPLDLPDLHRRYMAGESIPDLSRSVGVSRDSIRVRFRAAGLSIKDRAERMTHSWTARKGVSTESLVRKAHVFYMQGHSSIETAAEFGMQHANLRAYFKKLGLPVRHCSAAMHLRMSQTTVEQRLLLTEAAHKAVRGSKRSIETIAKQAAAVAAHPPRMSRYEQQFAALLTSAAIEFQFARSCGPYNIDFAIADSVAVEIFGGYWHTAAKHAARFQHRTRYLLDHGWHQIVVWVNRKRSEGPLTSAIRELRTLLDVASVQPSGIRKHLVIWSDGQLLAIEQSDVDHFTFKWTGKVCRNFVTGRYERPGH